MWHDDFTWWIRSIFYFSNLLCPIIIRQIKFWSNYSVFSERVWRGLRATAGRYQHLQLLATEIFGSILFHNDLVLHRRQIDLSSIFLYIIVALQFVSLLDLFFFFYLTLLYSVSFGFHCLWIREIHRLETEGYHWIHQTCQAFFVFCSTSGIPY